MQSREYLIIVRQSAAAKNRKVYQWVRTDGLLDTFTSLGFSGQRICVAAAKENAKKLGVKPIIIL